ncbi:hypothetical protein JZU71_05475, partial [bacterium]|nr:hypothetical protein [bacterium]
RANVVTYAMAKVFHDASKTDDVLDLDTIAKRQIVSEALDRVLLLAAETAHEVITKPVAGMRNFSEWAKQQACWSSLQTRKIDYGDWLERCLTLKESARKNERDAQDLRREMVGIEAQSLVVKLGADFWRSVGEQGHARRELTVKDQQIIKVCASLPRQIPTDKQSKHAIIILERLKEQGLLSHDLISQIDNRIP